MDVMVSQNTAARQHAQVGERAAAQGLRRFLREYAAFARGIAGGTGGGVLRSGASAPSATRDQEK